ncbi:tRNA:m(4)X modification enzyme TRM13 homolog isoform X1 [Megalops cyprinoides]|uniref:tRNA:m(4)X modification enzyme TRM13 homolog isoform X1 n=1 Tax=Megalops cyprinoides TaxID=118141 RepID=UPI001864D8A2|nr:tRNA:m(4)X modification enzyme TRM13 homolog isoform X1 [Megalops cyprinoides]
MAETTGDGVSAPLPGRCGFYVEKKKRYCKMVVASGKTFCGEHANADQEGERERIPCPLDPKHTVFKDNLTKHLKKCNSREKPKPVYYIQDINAGPEDDEDELDEIPLADRGKEELDSLVKKLKKAVQGLNFKHEERILSHPALCEALSDPKNGDCAFKHLKQQASLLGNMKALGLLVPSRCFVEFGAGRGKLSHWIRVALQGSDNVHFLLVERSSTRFKVDGKHKSADSVFERLQVDIQHLSLCKVPLLHEKGLPLIGVGKHLCGAATDLALRCMLESAQSDSSKHSDQPPRKRLKQEHQCERGGTDTEPRSAAVETETGKELAVSGLAIALCCHHRCDWRHYVGKEFFRERGLGAVEFAAFQRMSSWATCGLRKASDRRDGSPPQGDGNEQWGGEEEHEQGGVAIPSSLDGIVSAEDREHVGRLCKLLIDHGRVDYLQRKGFTSSLQYYTSPDISLENVLLTAVPTATG